MKAHLFSSGNKTAMLAHIGGELDSGTLVLCHVGRYIFFHTGGKLDTDEAVPCAAWLGC